MEENKLTICANCKHRILGNSGTGNPDLWHNNLCRAFSKTKDNFNAVTGKYEKDELNYCRDINTRGNCVKYEEKSTRKSFYKTMLEMWKRSPSSPFKS